MYRVLIADDSAYIRETLGDILNRAGYEIVAEAADGQIAVDAYTATRPDIVMLDMTMKDESGIETLKKIIEIDETAIIIMLAVVGKPEKVLEALNHGAKGYVTKPFDETSILGAIKQATAEAL